MIRVQNLTKGFGGTKALDNVSCEIGTGCIFGLVGANGAGKSTLLRLISGIYKPDEGSITIDGEEVYDNPRVRSRLVFSPDTMQLLTRSDTIERMAKYYATCYEKFSYEKFNRICSLFRLSQKTRCVNLSKGMVRQAQTALTLSCNADIVMLDETFDGLDPVARNAAKKLIYSEVCDRNATIIITSHSLRELEDTCDQLAMLYKGGIVFQRDVTELKTNQFKIQVAFADGCDRNRFEGFDVLSYNQSGSVANVIIRGDRDTTEEKIRAMNPVLLEILPLSLEEVFIYEMDTLGYRLEEIL